MSKSDYIAASEDSNFNGPSEVTIARIKFRQGVIVAVVLTLGGIATGYLRWGRNTGMLTSNGAKEVALARAVESTGIVSSTFRHGMSRLSLA